MKILAFTDIHASITSYKKLRTKVRKNKPDYLFCLGDFTIFEQNVDEILDKINDLNVPTYLLHGNHETGPVVKKLCKKHNNIAYIHKTLTKLGKYTIVAHGGGGFYGQGEHLDRDDDFDKWIKRQKKKLKKPLILLTHAPAANTKLDYIDYLEAHVGCPSYRDFIDTHKPALALSGHIHESFKVKYKHGTTTLSNPGPEGTIYTL